jgi:urocanate hydratase
MSPQPFIYRRYAALQATIPFHPESGLGGKLLYAGDLATGTELLYAANIAGAASLAASADPAAQRQAIRDGVIDFLVTSLEEAVRILKNEIRKHQTVSVGVGIAPDQLMAEMLDRGLLPDLLPTGELREEQAARFLRQGALQIENFDLVDLSYVTWSIEQNAARVLPQIYSLAQRILPDADVLRQRWLGLAPRYLGRQAQRHHGVAMTEEEFALFSASVMDPASVTTTGSLDPCAITLKKSNF